MSAQTKFPGRALVIGIADYVEAPALPLAVRHDVEDIVSALTDPQVSDYPADQIECLIDGAATAAAIREGLARLERESRIGDTVLIYFSGHGVRRPVPGLLAADVDLQTGRHTVIGRDELSEMLTRIVSDRIVVILDSCHSGAAAVLKGETPAGLSDADIGRLFTGSGRVIIASSAEAQSSAILPGERNSLFTGKLLAALRGDAFGDGETIDILQLYSTAAAATRLARPEQTPVLKADVQHDFPVALRPVKTSPSSRMASMLTSKSMDLWEVMAELYPLGPQDQHVWRRAGGDVSRLTLTGQGRADWYDAIRMLNLGGGGPITTVRLTDTALGDYPRHPRLQS